MYKAIPDPRAHRDFKVLRARLAQPARRDLKVLLGFRVTQALKAQQVQPDLRETPALKARRACKVPQALLGRKDLKD